MIITLFIVSLLENGIEKLEIDNSTDALDTCATHNHVQANEYKSNVINSISLFSATEKDQHDTENITALATHDGW